MNFILVYNNNNNNQILKSPPICTRLLVRKGQGTPIIGDPKEEHTFLNMIDRVFIISCTMINVDLGLSRN
jgi:hypothetical protein